jgi:K+-sensing histidine kinase KdpD
MGRALAREHEAAEELRSLDELKTTFLRAVSHDLRTPLASILGLAMTLRRHDLVLPAEERLDLADRIARSARKLDRLVNDLLDVERIEPARSRSPVGPRTSARWRGSSSTPLTRPGTRSTSRPIPWSRTSTRSRSSGS